MKVKSMRCFVTQVATVRDHTDVVNLSTGEIVERTFSDLEKTEACVSTLDGESFNLPVFAGCKPGTEVIVTVTEVTK